VGGWAFGLGAANVHPAAAGKVQPAYPPVDGPVVQQAKIAAGQDQFGDPLPAMAVARLGTLTFRHGPIPGLGMLDFTPDGEHLISLGGGWIRRWDLATGKAIVNIGEGLRNGRFDAQLSFSADGKLACIYKDVPLPVKESAKPPADGFGGFGGGKLGGKGPPAPPTTWEGTEYDLETGKVRRTFRLNFPRPKAGESWPYRCFLSTDGKVAANFDSREITVWSNVTGSIEKQISLPGGHFTAMQMTSDGKTVIAGDDEHTIHVYDVTSGKELRSFGIANINGVACMALSPDAKSLATIDGAGGYLRLWDLEKGTETQAFGIPRKGSVQTLRFTPDGNKVVVGLNESATGVEVVWLWDVNEERPRLEWRGKASIFAVHPDWKMTAAMNQAGVIQLWDLKTGGELHKAESSPGGLTSVCFTSNGKAVLTVGDDLAVCTWDANTGKLIGSLKSPIKGEAPVFVAGGKLLVKDHGYLNLFDPATGKQVEFGNGEYLVVSPDGKRVAISSNGGRVHIYVMESGEFVHRWKAPSDPQDRNLDGENWRYPAVVGFTPDGKSLVFQGTIVSVCDAETGQQKTSWSLKRKNVLEYNTANGPFGDADRMFIASVVSAAASPDGTKIALALNRRQGKGAADMGLVERQSRLMILETATGKLLHQSEVGDPQFFRQICFSPDGKLLAACGWNTIRVWEVGTEKAKWEFDGHRGFVQSLAFSPDGSRLASVAQDSTGLVWKLAK
jgi:WD40 repeat protein